MPILATSSGPLIPRVLSISYSYKTKHKSHEQRKASANPHRIYNDIGHEFLISESYHRQAMTVPAKSSVHMEATLMGKAGNNVLNGAS